LGEVLDVAVVGSGAAGIAAARRLVEKNRSVLLIEALPRLGGRAHTDFTHGMPLDLGCGWMHSADRNPLAALAEKNGQTVDRSEGAWSRQLRNIGICPQSQHEAWDAFKRFKDRLRASPPPDDRASAAMPPGTRWRPFADALSSFLNGVELDQLSAADFIAYENAATATNWRLPNGYGEFIAGLGAMLPVALATRVNAVSCGDGVVLNTDRGTIRASTAIVTVSTAVLARGDIRFEPAADDHLHAASQLPLGLADKIFFSTATPDAVPAESHLLGRFDMAATGSYYLRPFGRPLVECFLGGAWARDLERRGKDAAISFAREQLKDLLGADFARSLTPMAVTQWAQEATIGGSYSHALPGQAEARSLLSQPVGGRLCFAGEACSKHDFSTVHGAWQSGIEAADMTERFLAGKGG
jgi:monoamine oxidase